MGQQKSRTSRNQEHLETKLFASRPRRTHCRSSAVVDFAQDVDEVFGLEKPPSCIGSSCDRVFARRRGTLGETKGLRGVKIRWHKKQVSPVNVLGH